MNGNTTGGGSSTGSSNNNSNSNNSIYDYSFVNPNTQYPQPSIATTTTITTTTMNHNTHHSQPLHSVFAPPPPPPPPATTTTTTTNPYHHRFSTTTANPQQHGPSTASYDPTINSTSSSNNNNSNQLYMAYINASFNHPSQQQPQLSPRSRPATTAPHHQQQQHHHQHQHHQHQHQHHHSYLNNHPYHTSGAVTTLSPIMTATTTPSVLDNHLDNRDLSPIPLLHGDDNNKNNDNLNILYSNNNNNNRRIRARNINSNNSNNNIDITDTATAQQQLDHLLFGGSDLLLLGNDHLLDDPNLILFPSTVGPTLPSATTTAATAATSQQHRRTQQQQMYFQQQQQQPHSSSSLQIEAYLTMKASFQPQQQSNTTTASSLFSDNSACTMPPRGAYNHTTGKSPTPSSDQTLSLLHTKIVHEPWMDEIQLNVSSISLTPISGFEIIQRIQSKLQDVVYKYIPCVDFLVNCQQDLRRGIETMTTQKRYEKQHGSRSNHTNSKQLLREIQYGNQFYMAYISDLSSKFYNQTKGKMIQFRSSSSYGDATDTDVNEFLSEAMKGLASLQQDAHRILTDQQQHIRTSTSTTTAAAAALIQNGCCEAIKSAYLGGMKDGESWGLRKWLSKHGNALHVCTDLECILNACQKLPRGNHTTRLLAKQLRQMTKPILQYLQKEIPPSYQKHSSAHPYLPFFHRLESALRSMSNFDPDDDDVICLDDDDDDDSDNNNQQSNSNNKVSNSGDCDDDDDDVVEVDPIHTKPTAILTNNNSKNKKRSAVDATSTSSDNNNSPDDDDEEDMDVTERKRSNIHGRSISTTNGYHHITHNGSNMNYKNDNKYEMLDDDNQSSSGESEVQSIVEIIDIIGNPSTDPTMTTITTTANGQSGHTNNNNNNNNNNTHGDWQCSNCFLSNAASDTTCLVCGEETSLKDLLNFSRMEDFFDSDNNNNNTTSDDEDENNRVLRTGGLSGTNETSVATATNSMRSLHHHQQVPLWPVPIDEPEVKRSVALIIANNLEKIATMFDQDQQASIRTIHIPDGSFWDGEHYGSALRLFAQIIRSPESYHFLECVDDDQLHQAGNNPLFSHVIKHPLSLRQIARSLLGDEIQQWSSNDHQNSNHLNGEDGYLKVRGLSKWNMWIGKDLLQAIDLVFLNSLAYGNALNQGRSQHRSSTNQLRKKFWNGITEILNNIDLENRKQSMPTRRAEKSGFVVYKIGES